MIITRIVHQQIFQLRWQLLACLGLIMIMPLEEVAVNLVDGSGFYTEGMVAISLILSPFLAGLIACANVQADLVDKRFIFWMSKPTRVTSFITLKYIVGLLLALFVLACPVIFNVIGNIIYQPNNRFLAGKEGRAMLLIVSMITVLSYSLCFLCNVVVRKTARAWLIGMTATAFFLLTPFVLPLNFRDVVSDMARLASNLYIGILLAAVVTTFLVSILAVKRNWHLQTNLKGLFWAGAGLVFILMMIFSRQIANIKVLDEIETGMHPSSKFQYFDDRMVLGCRHVQFKDKYVNIKDDHIELEPAKLPSEMPDEFKNIKPLYEVENDLYCITHHYGKLFYETDNGTYSFKLKMYYQKKKLGKTTFERHCKKIYLCSYKLVNDYYYTPIAAIDLSDFIRNESFIHEAMRLLDDKLVVLGNKSYAVVKITCTGQLELLEKKLRAIRPKARYSKYTETYDIPLIATQYISIGEQIKLSIDYHSGHLAYFNSNSIVDMHDGRTSFIRFGEFHISRYDVVEWDDKFVYCKLRDFRPFTLLEQMFGQIHCSRNDFVKDGKLYTFEEQKLLVFDVRSDRIRKLGHFERLSKDFCIEDIEVLDDGNILMFSCPENHRAANNRGWIMKSYLYLLKNPE